jgi:hypothetical protein
MEQVPQLVCNYLCVARGAMNISVEMSEHDFNAFRCLPCLIDFTELEQHLNCTKDNIISL